MDESKGVKGGRDVEDRRDRLCVYLRSHERGFSKSLMHVWMLMSGIDETGDFVYIE